MVYKTNESIIVIQAEAINPIRTGVVFWSHDRGTAKLRFKLQKDGVNQNLPEGTTVPIRLVFKSSTAQGGYGKHDYLATIEDRLNGIVSIILEDNILGYQGNVEGSIYIDFPNDQSLDTAGRFSFNIKRSPIDDSTPELEDYYFNGFSQTIDKIEQMISDAETRIDTKVTETKKEIDAEIEEVKYSISESETSLAALNNNMTALGEKITEADQHFVSKESVEMGPLIFKNTNITTEDWNDITERGIYYCAASSGANMPHGGPIYGYLTVINAQGVIIQKHEFSSAIYMRSFSGNPAAWGEWKKIALASEVVDLIQPQSIGGVKNFVDGLQMAGKEVAVQDQIPLCGIYGEGTNLSKIPNGTKIPIGPLVATDFGHEVSDLPYTISSDGNTLTTTRACVLLFEGTIKIHGDNTLKYAYVKIRKNGSDTNFTNLGSSVVFNYMTTQSGQYVHTLAAGDKVEFTIGIASGGVLYATQLLSLKITEVKAVQS